MDLKKEKRYTITLVVGLLALVVVVVGGLFAYGTELHKEEEDKTTLTYKNVESVDVKVWDTYHYYLSENGPYVKIKYGIYANHTRLWYKVYDRNDELKTYIDFEGQDFIFQINYRVN